MRKTFLKTRWVRKENESVIVLLINWLKILDLRR